MPSHGDHDVPISDPDELVPTRVAAAVLGVGEGTLRYWRHHGRGPAYAKVGHCVRYRRSDLQAWIEERIVRPDDAA